MRTFGIYALALTTTLSLAQLAHSADRVWTSNSSGNWSNTANWSPIGLPQEGDRVFATTISPQQVVINFDDNRNPVRQYASMLIDSNGPGSMTVQQSAFQLMTGAMSIGGAGRGSYVINGGILSTGTMNLTSLGRLSMSGNAAVESTFFNHNGTLTATGGILYAGVYTQNGVFDTTGSGDHITALVSAVEFNANNPTFGGSLRVFNQLRLNVGSLAINGDFESRLESYTLPADRTIGVGQDVTINNGTFIQRGNFFTSPGGTIHGGGSSDTLIRGGAHWNLQSGTNIGARLFVGSSGTGVASYTMSGAGTTDFKIMQIANEASGAFTQSIGTVKTNGLLVGGGTIGPSSGTYTINSGTLNVAFDTIIGRDGAASGAMRQNGGTVRIEGPLTINENANSRGAYAMSNGSLSIGGRTLNHGSFSQSGGVSTFGANIDGAGTVTVTGGTMNVKRVRQRAIAIGGTGVIREWPDNFLTEPPVHRVESLTFENGANNTIKGTWDLGGTHMVVDYSGASPIADIQRYVQSGFANGAWTATGIRTRTGTMFPPGVVGLAVVEASQLLGANGGFFGDLAVDSTAVLVRPVLSGDTDLNGVINYDDYARLDAGFNNGGRDWLHGDFNYDGKVNFDDYALIDLAFNTQSGLLKSVVPEPTTISTVISIVSGICLTRCRRKVA